MKTRYMNQEYDDAADLALIDSVGRGCSWVTNLCVGFEKSCSKRDYQVGKKNLVSS